MKKTIGFLLVSAMALSCREKSALTAVPCCARENDAVKLSPGIAQGNASIYQLPGSWTDQHDRRVTLDALKGKVQVAAMIFTHCGNACPRLVQDMKAIQEALPGAARGQVGFVLVSFDTQRDDPAELGRYAQAQQLDGQWTLLHGSAEEVRGLSMLFNVKYLRLEDGNFTHSNAIFILDRDGAIRQSLDGLDPQTGSAIGAINELLATN